MRGPAARGWFRGRSDLVYGINTRGKFAAGCPSGRGICNYRFERERGEGIREMRAVCGTVDLRG